MVDFGLALRSAVRGAFCGQLGATAGAAADFMEDLTFGLPGGVRIPTTPAVVGQAINAYLDACPASGGPYPAPAVPFLGGQCPVDYSVFVTFDRYINNDLAQANQEASAPLGLRGPISSVVINGADPRYVRVTYNGGQVFDFPTGTPPAGTNLRNLRNIILVRRDGNPDNCGNPPSIGIDFDYDGPDGDPVNVPNVNFEFGGPRINLGGNIIVPVFSPELGLNLDFNLNTGDIDLNFGGDGDNSACCLPPDTDEPPPPPVDPPEENEGLPIIGVIVSAVVNQAFNLTEVFLEQGPNLWLRRLGSVTFAVPVGSGESPEWLEPIDVKLLRSFVPCPAPQGAASYVVNPVPGVSFFLTTVRAKIPTTFEV